MRLPRLIRRWAIVALVGIMVVLPAGKTTGMDMDQVPVKKYRTKRAFKWLKRAVVPESMHVGKVVRKWRRPDREDWPPPERADQSGLQRYEYKLLSQNGEDGILRHLFEQVGFGPRLCVEFGFHAAQCCALRLLLHERFGGLLMDGGATQCRLFNRAAARVGVSGARAVQAFITLENLETLITGSGLSGEIDFLSIDVNGNDYWFWQSLECVSPRVVCIEYNAGIGPDLSWSSPYSPDFDRYAAHPGGFFYGASLAALEALGREKGYRLTGCDSTGTNAFFLRADLDAPDVPTLTPREAYKPHANWLGRGLSEERQLEIMRSMPYVEV